MQRFHRQRTLDFLTLLISIVSLALMSNAVVGQMGGPGGPGGGIDCSSLVPPGGSSDPCFTYISATDPSEECCSCDSAPSADCTPVVAGSPDPQTLPPDTGSDCYPAEGTVAGVSFWGKDSEAMAATQINAVADAYLMTSAVCGGTCPPLCSGGSCKADIRTTAPKSNCSSCDSGGGSGGGGGGAPTVYGNGRYPSIFISRRLVPANRTEVFSFGRGMASEYDIRMTLYSSNTSDPAMILYDPLLETTFYLEDTGSNGTYDLDDDIYYESVKLTDSSGGAVDDPAYATTQTVYATVTRRNGWVYEMEVCPTPLHGGAFTARLNRYESPQGFGVDFTYKTFTQTQLDDSPERQLQIDTITDMFGNSADVTYNSTQQSGLWVISEIDINSGEIELEYTYDTNGLLSTVERGTEVVSTYTYGTDSTYNLATLTWHERERYDHHRNDTLLLSLDYQNGDDTVVNQYMNVIQGRRNGGGQIKSMIYRDQTNPGWYKILNEGRMVQIKMGESYRYYVTWSDAGTGYSGITGTLESVWPYASSMTASLIATNQPPGWVDKTGYSVTYQYDSDGNLYKETHPDSTWRQWGYDSNNQVNYYRDRAGYVTVTERDSNHNITRIIRGMTDSSGSGSPTATTEATQVIFGYYTSGANAKMLAWSATTAYSGTTFSAPPANERSDYTYNSNQRLTKVQYPLPNGQSTRPEMTFGWTGNSVSSSVNRLGHTTTYSYDVLGRETETLYSDGTKTQVLYDDVNNSIYTRNRLGIVSSRVHETSGRLSATYQAYAEDADLSDGLLDITNPVNEVTSSFFYYPIGVSYPQNVYRESALTTTNYDYRGRVSAVKQFPRTGTDLETLHTYVDNLRFYTTQKVGTHEVRTYYGYSADRQTVRTIETRKPGVTFANNAAVLSASRLTTADPDRIINDAIRDTRGQIVQLIDPLDITIQTTYDALGRSTIQSRSGGTLSLSTQSSYDADSNVTQTISEAGVATDMTYDPAGNLQTRTVAPGTSLAATWTYTYTKDNKQKTVTAPDTGVTTMVYETCCGFTTGTKNALGHGTITNRNSEGRPVHTAVVEDYATHTNLLNPTDAKTLSETTTKYRDDGRVQFRTVWKSALGTIDRNDPPIAGIDGVAAANGVTTQYLYDALLFDDADLDSTAGLQIDRLGGGTANVSIKAATDKLADTIANGGAGISFAVGRAGKANVAILPDEKTMQVSITDATGRSIMNALMSGPAATTPNQLLTWSCTLHDQIDSTTTSIAALKTSSIDEDGNQTHVVQDGFGLSIASVDQLGNVSISSYDSGGNLLKSTDALSHDTDFTYDDLGRQLTITDELGNVVTTAYDSSTGQISSRTDAKSNSTSYLYDDLGRVSAETDRLGEVTTKTYDDVGRLETIKDAENRTTTYGYNLLGQRTSTTLADSSAKAMTYDAAGRLEETTLASGIKQKNIYEFSGVVDKIEYRNSGGTLTGTDDYSYDSQLRRSGSVSRDGVTRALTYTDRGQLDTDTTTYSSQSYVVDYDYDSRGRLDEITYPSGRKAAYAYTTRGELDTIDWAGTQIEDRDYNQIGLLTSVDRQAVDETRAYDDVNRVTSIANTNVGTATYTYDANGNKLTESWTGAMSGWNFTTVNTGTYTDGYDAEDRFRNFKQTGQSIDLYLDRTDIGNISNYKLNGTDSLRSYSNIHELTSVGGTAQTFDTDGNLTVDHTGVDLGWDGAGMLDQTVVSAGDTAGIEGTNEYGYDSDQKRVWKKITRSGSVAEHTVYIYAGSNCIAEYDAGTAAASPDQEYVYAQDVDSLVMVVRSGGSQKLTVTRNQQWSVSALSDASTGSVLERYGYDAFGNRTILESNGTTARTSSSYNMPYGYTSRRHDDESGLMYFRARYYQDLTGEFTSKDSREFLDGMSLYRGYLVPNYLDPSGELVVLAPVPIRPKQCEQAKQLAKQKYADIYNKIRSLGCPEPEVNCMNCDPPLLPKRGPDKAPAVFRPYIKDIQVCYNRISTVDHAVDIIGHELAHAADDCKGADPTSCRQRICLEIRANSVCNCSIRSPERRNKTREKCIKDQTRGSSFGKFGCHKYSKKALDVLIDAMYSKCKVERCAGLPDWPLDPYESPMSPDCFIRY